MATKIRLARAGAKKRPYYHIVVTDVRAPRDGKYIERIGSYNPMLPKGEEKRVIINTDRAKYWLGEGAQPTDRVQYFFNQAGLVDKAPAQKPARKAKKAPEEEPEAPAAEGGDAPAEEAKAEEAPAADAEAESTDAA